MNKKNSQRKEKRMNLMIYIWMIVRVPVILGILVGFFYLPLITQPKIPDICLVRIFSLLLFALGVLIIVHSTTSITGTPTKIPVKIIIPIVHSLGINASTPLVVLLSVIVLLSGMVLLFGLFLF